MVAIKRHMHHRILLVVNFLFFAGSLFPAVNLNVKGLKSENNASGESCRVAFMGESFEVQVTVESGRQGSASPHVQGIDQFNVVSSGSSNQMTIINGHASSKMTYTYYLQPKREGNFILGPATTTGDGQSSGSVRIVARVRTQKDVEQVGGQTTPIEAQLVVEQKSVYVGQPLTVMLRIAQWSDQITNVSIGNPDFPGFSVKALEHEIRQIEKNGQQGHLIEKKYILTAVEAGTFSIDPMTVVYHVPDLRYRGSMFDDLFFGGQRLGRQQSLQTNSTAITIKPLPESTQQIDGVGVFDGYHLTVDKAQAQVNEPLKITLSLTGVASFDHITTPKLTLPQSSKSYESKQYMAYENQAPDGESKKVFEYVLQVGRAGTVIIPAQKFVYFDTDEEQIHVLQTKPVELQMIAPESDSTSAQSSGGIFSSSEVPAAPSQPQVSLPKTIHYIEESWSGGSFPQGFPWWVFAILMFIPVIYFGAAPFSHKFLTKNVSRGALKKALDELDDPQLKVSALYTIISVYFSERFSESLSHISEDWIAKTLAISGMEPDKVADFAALLHECASASFGRSDQASANQLKKEVQSWLNVIDECVSNSKKV